MIAVAMIALIVNSLCMLILSKHPEGEIHMLASWILLTNDVIANELVIVAGILVKLTGSHFPDLVTGAVIGVIVLTGSSKILKAAKV